MVQIKQVVPKEHHIREECGVFGVFSKEPADVASLAYYGLFALQHRGQESAGIAVNDDGVFTTYRDEGLVNEVFPKERLQRLGERKHRRGARPLCHHRLRPQAQCPAHHHQPPQGADGAGTQRKSDQLL